MIRRAPPERPTSPSSRSRTGSPPCAAPTASSWSTADVSWKPARTPSSWRTAAPMPARPPAGPARPGPFRRRPRARLPALIQHGGLSPSPSTDGDGSRPCVGFSLKSYVFPPITANKSYPSTIEAASAHGPCSNLPKNPLRRGSGRRRESPDRRRRNWQLPILPWRQPLHRQDVRDRIRILPAKERRWFEEANLVSIATTLMLHPGRWTSPASIHMQRSPLPAQRRGIRSKVRLEDPDLHHEHEGTFRRPSGLPSSRPCRSRRRPRLQVLRRADENIRPIPAELSPSPSPPGDAFSMEKNPTCDRSFLRPTRCGSASEVQVFLFRPFRQKDGRTHGIDFGGCGPGGVDRRQGRRQEAVVERHPVGFARHLGFDGRLGACPMPWSTTDCTIAGPVRLERDVDIECLWREEPPPSRPSGARARHHGLSLELLQDERAVVRERGLDEAETVPRSRT